MTTDKRRKVGAKYKRHSSGEQIGELAEPVEFSSLVEQSSHEKSAEFDSIEAMATPKQLDEIFKRLQKLDILDSINDRLINFEKELTEVKSKVADLEQSNNFLSSRIANLESQKCDKSTLDKLEERVEDLANRNRRNNLVFLNIPENMEAKYKGNCSELIKNIITENLNLNIDADTFIMDRAHRTPTHLPNNPRPKPRPIHVAFHHYRDRQSVLRAAKNLKINPFPSPDAKFKLVITEDVTPKLQAERAKLWKHRKTLMQENPGRKIYVNYPASLRIIEPDGSTRKIEANDL